MSTATPREEEFFAANLRRIHRQIYRMVGNFSDAQDLTQETFIKAMQSRAQLRHDDKAGHWLSRIATNLTLDFLRSKRKRCFVELDENLAAGSGDPEHNAICSADRDLLRCVLGRLTDRERAALILRDVQGLPAKQVAATLGCSKATVRSHIANARIKLRAQLARRSTVGGGAPLAHSPTR